MSVEITNVQFSNGTVTVTGTKPSGQGTVTVTIDNEVLNSTTTSATSWTVSGTRALTPGSHNVVVQYTGGKEVTFTLKVLPNLSVQIIGGPLNQQ